MWNVLHPGFSLILTNPHGLRAKAATHRTLQAAGTPGSYNPIEG